MDQGESTELNTGRNQDFTNTKMLILNTNYIIILMLFDEL